MPDLPDGMWSRGRDPDEHFASDERLYRRVPKYLWADPVRGVGIAAIALPDMSVLRSKYAHPEWARFSGDSYTYHDWGVVSFAVGDLPSPLKEEGVFEFEFSPAHAPLQKNYPHSEVRVLQDGSRVGPSDELSQAVHLRWRFQLLCKIRSEISPNDSVEVRAAPPQA